MPQWLTISLAIVGVMGPMGTLLVLAVRHGKALQKVEALQEDVQEIKASIPTCQKERRAQESELHSRVTEVVKHQAAHVERTGGIADRLQRVEKKVLNGHAHA